MSVSYPYLPLSTFPETIDTFPNWLNVVATDGPKILQYHNALQVGNYTLANQILNQIPSFTQKIIKATDLNKLSQCIVALETFYNSDVKPYIENKQLEWQAIIDRFSFKGAWDSNATYTVNNFVSYVFSGQELLYIAYANPPVGTPPTNSTYWRVFTIKGEKGETGKGLSYQKKWQPEISYGVEVLVSFEGSIWQSLKPSQGIRPGTDETTWKQIIKPEVASYPIQPTEPLNLNQGGLWFNTQKNPTDYYYLEILENPALSEDIKSGKMAYDSKGNVIIGTMP